MEGYTIDEMRKGLALSRRVLHLTQNQLALRAGISGSKLSLWENGLVELKPQELRKLESALDKAYQKSHQKWAGDGPPMRPLEVLKGRSKGFWRTEVEGLDPILERKLRRQQLGLNQRELARISGIPRNKLIKWEAGTVQLSADEQQRWEAALDAARKKDPYLRWKIKDEVISDLWEQRKRHQATIKDLEKQLLFFQTQVTRLEHSNSLDDPIVQEVIASLRREIAKLEQQRAEQPQGPALEEKADG
jgi:transcriptional regulator with XRE-family HTH domain